MSYKYSLEVLKVFNEPQNVSIFQGVSDSKSFISEILLNIIILSINFEGAMGGQVFGLYISICHCFINTTTLWDNERYKNDNSFVEKQVKLFF